MASQFIGKVKSGRGKSYDVKWNSSSKEVWMSLPGVFGDNVKNAGSKSSSASDAMRIAEAYL